MLNLLPVFRLRTPLVGGTNMHLVRVRSAVVAIAQLDEPLNEVLLVQKRGTRWIKAPDVNSPPVPLWAQHCLPQVLATRSEGSDSESHHCLQLSAHILIEAPFSMGSSQFASVRSSTSPLSALLTAPSTSIVTVPNLGFGPSPRGPNSPLGDDGHHVWRRVIEARLCSPTGSPPRSSAPRWRPPQ